MIKVKDMVAIDFNPHWSYTPAWVYSVDGNVVTVMYSDKSIDHIDVSRITLAADIASYLDSWDRDSLEMGWCPF